MPVQEDIAEEVGEHDEIDNVLTRTLVASASCAS